MKKIWIANQNNSESEVIGVGNTVNIWLYKKEVRYLKLKMLHWSSNYNPAVKPF